MSESIDLQARVLEATVLHQTKIDADIRRAAEAKIWDEDNKYILGYLQQAVGVLAFPEVVEKQRSVLYQTKRYPKRPDRAEGMEIRPIRWIADNSETTQSQPARVRAAVGHAVLLSSRSEGVNGSLSEQGEDIQECFYALGLAVEVNDSFWFSSLFAKDPNAGSYKCGELYRLLTLEKYTNHVRRYNEAQFRAYCDDGLLADEEEHVAGYNRRANGMEGAFRRKMEEDFPKLTMQAQNDRQSQEVRDLILGQPTKRSTSYKEQLMPRVDISAIETHKDRLVLAEAFTSFLGQSDIVKGWIK